MRWIVKSEWRINGASIVNSLSAARLLRENSGHKDHEDQDAQADEAQEGSDGAQGHSRVRGCVVAARGGGRRRGGSGDGDLAHDVVGDALEVRRPQARRGVL